MSVRHKLILAFMGVSSISAVIGYFGMNAANSVEAVYRNVSKDFTPFAQAATEITTYSKLMENRLYTYLMFGNKESKERFYRRSTSLGKRIPELLDLTESSNDKEIVFQMRTEAESARKLGEEIIAIYERASKPFKFREHSELITEFRRATAAVRKGGVKLSALKANLFVDQKVIDSTLSIIGYSKLIEGRLYFHIMLGTEESKQKFYSRFASLRELISSLKKTHGAIEIAQDKSLLEEMDSQTEVGIGIANKILAIYETNPTTFDPKAHQELLTKFRNSTARVRKAADKMQKARIQKITRASEALLDKTMAMRRKIVSITITLFVLALVIGYMVARSIATPIKNLADASTRIGNGMFDTRIEVKSNDELGLLATSFNKMAAALKKSRNEIVSARDYIDNIIKSMSDAVIVLNTDATIKTINQATLTLLGYRSNELIGRRFDELLIEGDKHRFMDSVLEKLGQKGSIANADKIFISKDRRRIPVLLSGSAMCDGEGQLQAIVCVAKDITERKRIEKELLHSNGELRQFAYLASHDLQEPLRIVASYTALLSRRYKGRLDSNADEIISIAVDAAKHMQQLINDLLSFSQLSRQERVLAPFDSEILLSQALANLREATAEADAVVTHDPLPKVMADRAQLAQVVQNLIGNAIKYRGNERPKIHVSARRKNGEWLFSVRDNGIGIEPQYAERIFILFQRLHNKSEYTGTGIGLTICKKAIDHHGGRIWVESELKKGSTFYFTIPETPHPSQRAGISTPKSNMDFGTPPSTLLTDNGRDAPPPAA